LGVEDADFLHLPAFGGFGPADFQVEAFGGEFYILYIQAHKLTTAYGPKEAYKYQGPIPKAFYPAIPSD
jgi:hypothetical protein